MKDPSSKLMRMRLDLDEYDFEIEHIRGKENVIADALSRIDFKDIRDNAIDAINCVFKVQTRSETRKICEDQLKANVTHGESIADEKEGYVPIYEA